MTRGHATTGTTALITGASSGIGYEFARVFAHRGHNLVLVARDAQRLERLASELRAVHPISVKVIAKDLSVPTSAEEIYAEMQRESIPVEILVNNAGVIVYGNFAETDLAKDMQLIQVNLLTLTQLTKLFLKDMVRRGSGKIMNVGSIGSFTPSPMNAVYSATKAYVLSFSEAIAEELRDTGVTVTALCVGAAKTELQKRAQMDTVFLLNFAMRADAVAEIGYRGMMKGKRIVVPGPLFQFSVFLTRLLPRIVVVKLAKIALSRPE